MGDKLTTPAAYTASAVTGLFGMVDWNTVATIGGLVLAILTFAVNWYYKRKNSKAFEAAILKGGPVHEPKD